MKWSILLILILSASLVQADNKPVSGFALYEDGFTPSFNTRIYIDVKTKDMNCTSLPVFTDEQGYFITDLKNLVDAHGEDCGDRWDASDTFWVRCDGSTTIPYPQHNGTTTPLPIPDTSGHLLNAGVCTLTYPPPIVIAVSPTSYSIFETSPVQFQVVTNEPSTCRWNFISSEYAEKEIEMEGSGIIHNSSLSFPPASNFYTLFIMCLNQHGKHSSEFNITYEYHAPPVSVPTPPVPGAGGGGGGGGGGIALPSPDSTLGSTPQPYAVSGSSCIPYWECSTWSRCDEQGIQTRVCNDRRLCNQNITQPEETRLCDYKNLCFNYFRDSEETDIDCGGVCGPCPSGRHCALDFDCVSGYCNPVKMCSVPSCNDGFKNQDETSIDCGGPCGSCSQQIVIEEQPDALTTFFFIPLFFVVLLFVIVLIPLFFLKKRRKK